MQRLTYSLHQDSVELLKAFGLSSPQYNILRILRGAGPSRPGLAAAEIGARLLAHAPDLTRLLDRMALQGLVVRARRSGDRRVVTRSITDKGLVLLGTLDAPLTALHERQLAHLGPERLTALLALLEAVQSLS